MVPQKSVQLIVQVCTIYSIVHCQKWGHSLVRSILSTVWHPWSCKSCRQVLHSRVLSCPAERPVNTNDHPVDLPTFFGRHFFPHNFLHYPVKIDPNKVLCGHMSLVEEDGLSQIVPTQTQRHIFEEILGVVGNFIRVIHPFCAPWRQA